MKKIFLILALFAINAYAEHSQIFDVQMDCSTIATSAIFASGQGVSIQTQNNCWSYDCRAIMLNNKSLCTSQDCRALVERDSSMCQSDLCKALLTQNNNLCGNNRNCTGILTNNAGMCQMKDVGCCKKCWCKGLMNPDGTIIRKKACCITSCLCGMIIPAIGVVAYALAIGGYG